jgi:hypothetical protein
LINSQLDQPSKKPSKIIFDSSKKNDIILIFLNNF